MILKSRLISRALLLALAVLCSSSPAFAQTTTETAPEQPANPRSGLTADLFYQLLVAEISAQQGDAPASYALTLDAARKTNAAQLYERAVELALSVRSGDSALAAAQAWTRALPASEEATRYALQILVGMNRLTEAPEIIKRHVAALPEKDRAGAIVLLPRYLARAADKRQAQDVVAQALDTELHNTTWGPAAWATVGTMRLLSGDAGGALQAVQRGATLRPTAPEPSSLALALMESKGDGAEAIVLKYLSGQPLPEIRVGYIRKLLDNQRYAEALEQSKVATSNTPMSAEGWLVRGSLEYQEKLWSQSQTSLQRYIELSKKPASNGNPTDQDRGLTQAYFLLSQIAEQNNNLDAAQNYLNQIESPQDALRVRTRKANLMAKQGNLNDALKLLRDTPEVQPDDARSKITAQAQLLRDFKRYQAAYDLLSSATQQYPNDVDLTYDLAMSAEKVGNVAEMETLLRKIIADKPDYHHAYNALGYSLADRAQRLDEAKQLIQKALEFSPNDPYILDSLGWVEFRSGNLNEALRILRDAYQAKPDPEISAHLGEVLWNMQLKDEAMAAWKAGMNLSGENETLNETMHRLAKP